VQFTSDAVKDAPCKSDKKGLLRRNQAGNAVFFTNSFVKFPMAGDQRDRIIGRTPERICLAMGASKAPARFMGGKRRAPGPRGIPGRFESLCRKTSNRSA